MIETLPNSRTQPPARTHPSDVRIGRVRRSLSLLLLLVAGVCFWNGLPDRLADDARQAVVADARAAVRAPQAVPETGDVSLNTTPIQDIRVGQRVQSHNPEVSANERESWDEPDWSQWQLVRLEMPKPDGSLLEIEVLRPQEWLDSQAALVVETREVIAHPGPMERAEGSELSAEGKRAAGARLSEPRPNQLSESGSALRAESPDRADATESRATESLDSGPSSLDSFQPMPLVPESVPVGLVVEMDLPELGLTDLAWVTDIADCPEIESRDSGRSAGGSVVTATFHHSSGDVIDLVVEDEGVSQPSSFRPHPSKETIGTTSNHPFWSVDRQEYVQAGQLEPGERVLTFSGDTKRIASKLARPGPQPVYNLEVHAEHVYFVGDNGLLVHNSKAYRDGWDQAFGSKRPTSSAHYSNWLDAKLTAGKHFPGNGDGVHFREANRQLLKRMQSDTKFAGALEAAHPGITDFLRPGVRGGMPDATPASVGLTWHHSPNRIGILELVPVDHHRAAGPVQSLLHPNQKGGMELWGGGRKKRKR